MTLPWDLVLVGSFSSVLFKNIFLRARMQRPVDEIDDLRIGKIDSII